ncbi:MAG: hypothetical protein O3A87_04475 [Verrucomicrobia bacterium]|nr:hypothetical protein [Verrucomicrobiota bacterium]MDA1005722.1 hypothetical protein [Verrucomicrobiota bacterium]
MKRRRLSLLLLSLVLSSNPLSSAEPSAETLLTLDNGTAKVGIDRGKGASITWLSWAAYPQNMINSADPGRLIQQSYYAGRSLDRTADGQWKAWSPWPWNPIQGGGVESWARVTEFKRIDQTLFSLTIPKLWDMPNEEASAVMKQWTTFEPGAPDVIAVRCKFTSRRTADDRWGPATLNSQEVPACYFTRNFDQIRSYLGGGRWRDEHQPAGPPWGHAKPPLLAMACFNAEGQGVAIFSPTSGDTWNFGPHQNKPSTDPAAGPCVHVAPVSRVKLAPKSTYTYRYWLVVGSEKQLASRLDFLHQKYAAERGTLTTP